MSTPCFDSLDDPDDDDIWGWGEEEDWRGEEHPAPLAVDWDGIEYMAGPEYRFYKELAETRWALTPLGETIRRQVKWPETKTFSTGRCDRYCEECGLNQRLGPMHRMNCSYWDRRAAARELTQLSQEMGLYDTGVPKKSE